MSYVSLSYTCQLCKFCKPPVPVPRARVGIPLDKSPVEGTVLSTACIPVPDKVCTQDVYSLSCLKVRRLVVEEECCLPQLFPRFQRPSDLLHELLLWEAGVIWMEFHNSLRGDADH